MGERVNGIHEVSGSIPLGSTSCFHKTSKAAARAHAALALVFILRFDVEQA